MFKSKKLALLYILISYVVAIVVGFVTFIYFNRVIDSVLWTTLLTDFIMTVIIFIFSRLANNSSVYDPYWSLIPPFIVLLWMFEMEVGVHWHLILIFIFVLCWSIRLTTNWVLNWPGMSYEDWRYQSFRHYRYYWGISFLCFHLFPTLLVFLGLLPVYYILSHVSSPNQVFYWIGAVISLVGVTTSLSADYSLTRHRNSFRSHKPIRRGLWKYSRHPNYLGEILFWLSLFMIGLGYYESYGYYLTGFGIVGMIVLFEAYSIPQMDKRQLERRPDYIDIIHSVPRLLPFRVTSKQRRLARHKL